jgi:hypothetical protein
MSMLEEENTMLKAQLESSYVAADQRQDTIGKGNAPPQRNTCQNLEARLMVCLPDQLPRKSTAHYNARIAMKPRAFSGTEARSSLALREWFAEVQHYVTSICWKYSQLVGAAVHFLSSDALQWWIRRTSALRQEGKDPADWCTFADALFSRWAHKNQEMAARTQLHYL